MKHKALKTIALLGLLGNLQAEVIHSTELNLRVWALPNITYPVDVDMDGSNDLFFYANHYALANSGQAYAYHLRLITAENTYVSTIGVPSIPEEGLNYMFTTFVEGTLIDETLTSAFYEWTTGDIQFLGFDIAGGIPSQDSYLAVKIVKESTVHYGWVRLIFPITYDYFDETSYVKIKESSYESTAATAITAGVGKSAQTTSYSSTLANDGSGSFELKLSGAEDMLCMLEESINLVDWDPVEVHYSTQTALTETIPQQGSFKFYRWQVSENLETIDQNQLINP